MHGTIRDREKVVRGLKIEDTPVITGHMIYYNFIRPNMSLNGKTPTEEARIELNLGNNRWLDLIKKSLEFRKESIFYNPKCNTILATPNVSTEPVRQKIQIVVTKKL